MKNQFPDDIIIKILEFVNQDGQFILVYDFQQKKFIEKEHPSYESDKIYVQKNGMYLRNVERKYQTEEMCKLAVKNNGMALKFVPKQTDEICKLAVQNIGGALKHVQKKQKNFVKLLFNVMV